MTATLERTSAAPPLVSPARRQAADRAWIVTVVVAANAVVVVGLWVRHGGIGAASGAGGLATAIGQLTALLGTYLVLIELLLMARMPWLERYMGFDRLAVWHRWNGFTCVWLLTGHVVFTTLGYAQGNRATILGQTRDFISNYPDVLMAFVGFALFLAVSVTSVRIARQKLSRETWYFVHLYAYLAVALSFAHQLAVGSDFSSDPAARAWWVALNLAVLGTILWCRVGTPVRFNLRHRLRVKGVRRETPGVVSIYLVGRRLDRINAQSGQFFLWRFLTPGGWWQAHPFSLSAPPTSRLLRITVKDLGDRTEELQRIAPGTRVWAEGPYGTFTAALRTRRRVLLIGGGIGITPLRALLETMPAAPGDITLLYRVSFSPTSCSATRSPRLGTERGIVLHALIGAEIGDDQTDKLGIPNIARLVPDVARPRLLRVRTSRSRRRGRSPPPQARSARDPDSLRTLRVLGAETMRRAVPAVVATAAALGLLATFHTTTGTATNSAAALPPGSQPSATAPAATQPPATAPPPRDRGDDSEGGTLPPATTPPATKPPATGSQNATRTFDGPVVENRFGPVQVRVTVSGDKIVDVQAVELPQDRRRSAEISTYAGPVLRQEALQAQSAQIDLVSGATYTSDSYAQSLQAALDQAGI